MIDTRSQKLPFSLWLPPLTSCLNFTNLQTVSIHQRSFYFTRQTVKLCSFIVPSVTLKRVMYIFYACFSPVITPYVLHRGVCLQSNIHHHTVGQIMYFATWNTSMLRSTLGIQNLIWDTSLEDSQLFLFRRAGSRKPVPTCIDSMTFVILKEFAPLQENRRHLMWIVLATALCLFRPKAPGWPFKTINQSLTLILKVTILDLC